MSLKILQLISSAGFFGAENVLLELSIELKNMGHTITIGTFNNLHNPNLELLEKAREYSINTEVFECKGKIDLKTIFQISSYVKENSIGIIHSHGYKSNIYAFLSNIKNRRPLITTCHNWINSNTKANFYTYLDKIFIKGFDAVVPVSKTVKELLLKAKVGGGKINLIENGINISRFAVKKNGVELRKEFAIDLNSKVIGTVGRLSEEKGHTYLLKAAGKVLSLQKDCFFMIIGDGILRSSLEEEAKKTGISDRVIFTGRRDDISDLFSIMDIFVLPSLTEGLPMALLEAMAAGKPVVATNVGDMPGILKNGRLGILTPPYNSDAIAEGILFYLNNIAESKKYASNAYNQVIDNYSSTRMAKEYLRVYRSLS